MGDVERRDDDTAVVIPTSSGRKRSARDPCPHRRRVLSESEDIPADELISGTVVKDGGFVFSTPGSGRDDDEEGEWIWADTAINARDER